ncbi:MAG TPA: flagellar hook-basal body protein [Rhodocyclaceae bacterium]|nr:flagellar hook-basal body protein [Rhodocyclaceae bacterium]
MDALTIAATSMLNDIDRVATVGHNLTNLSTPGYRRIVDTGEALRYAGLQSQATSLMLSVDASASTVDMNAGAAKSTGNPTDLAIDGNGFFELQSANGVLLTRRGDFQVDREGRLSSSSGDPVLGQNGPINFTSSSIRIEADGRIFDGDKLVDQLRIVSVANPASLVPQGNGTYVAAQTSVEDAKGYRIRQGVLEGSNVASATEMVQLIELVKHIESNQKVLQFEDELMGKALDKFAEL